MARRATTQRQAATSGVFLSRFHFGPLSKKHVSRDAYNHPPTAPFLLPNPPPPSTFQWEGVEQGGEKDHPHWDHSASIRPFHTLWTWNNRGLIAAVCLPARAGSTEACSSEALRLRSVRTDWDAPEDSSAQGDKALASFSPYTFGFLHSCHTANSHSWCRGNFWNSTLFSSTVHFGSNCAARKQQRARVELRWLLIFTHILVTFVKAINKEPNFYASQAS